MRLVQYELLKDCPFSGSIEISLVMRTSDPFEGSSIPTSAVTSVSEDSTWMSRRSSTVAAARRHDLMRPNEAGMLTKIRSLFLIRSPARWRKALRDAACPRTGRLASKHRAPPAISWCGFTGRRGARHLLGAICTASDCHIGPSARARRARSCGGARAAGVSSASLARSASTVVG